MPRLPLPSSEPQELEEDEIAKLTAELTAVTTELLHGAHKDCSVLQKVLKYLRTGWPRAVKGLYPALLPFYRLQTELAELNGDFW